MAKRRNAENPENVAARQKRFRESRPPEVRMIYIDKKHHKTIREFAQTLKTGENHDTN
jgi:hypothetical protein